MTEFTPLMSFVGGMMIGLAAISLMFFWGRIAGMSAIVIGVVPPLASDWAWKAAFLGGAILAPLALQAAGHKVEFSSPIPLAALIAGGLITGLGVTFGSSCTSGHGICGLARFSRRSAVATLSFMAAGFVTVFIIRHLI